MFLKCTLIFVITYFVFLQARLTPKELLQAEKECVVASGVNYDIVLSVKNTFNVSDDANYKKFLHCFYRKQGYLYENGTVVFDEIKQMLMQGDEGYTGTEADGILENCKNITSSNLVDVPQLVLKCILSHLPENAR